MDFQLFYIWPELILAAGGIICLAVGMGSRKWKMPGPVGILSPETLCGLTLVMAFVAAGTLFSSGYIVRGIPQFGGVLAVDGLAIFFKLVAIISSAIVMLLSVDFFRRLKFHRGEYYGLLLLATLAITMLAASTDLIMIYLSMEFLSITSYILVGYLKQDPKSNEAALKYFLYGSVAAAVMIYGMSILYGLTGTTNILMIAEKLTAEDMIVPYPLLFFAMLMTLVGLGFKMAVVPFHQWSPDAYEGAPTPITAFLSVGSKVAGVAIVARFLSTGITLRALDWVPFIVLLSGITMTVGNLVAIPQLNIKRMLAYSSIAQAGYMLLGIAASAYSPLALPAVALYVFIYMFMNLGAFAVVTLVSARIKSDEIRDYAGLIRRSPIAAGVMVFFLLSLAGIPPTAGFLGKFYLFSAAIQCGTRPLFWLAVVAIGNVVISVYYYMNVVRYMFFKPAKSEEPLPLSRSLGFVIGLTFAMTLIILVYGEPFIQMAHRSAMMLAGM